MLGELYLRSWWAAYEGLEDAARLRPVYERRAAHDWSEHVAAAGATTHIGIGEVDGVPAGLTAIGPDPAEAVPGTWLDLLYVVPEHWGCGLAVVLHEWALERAAADGCRLARLRVVEPQRRARRFYEREGWVDDDTVPPSTNELFSLRCLRIDPTSRASVR